MHEGVGARGFARSIAAGRMLSRYRLIEKIGEGGMGVVYRAHDERLERDVAVKVLPPGTLSDEAARKRFRTEALALSKLNHPNIAVIHDFDTEDGIDFLVMEYIPGQTLQHRLGGEPLAEAEVVRLGTQLADALFAAHEHGVLHRDLKPGNLRVTPEGRLKILDFGLTKLLQPASETAPTQTQTRGIVGTLRYMAPEQLRGGEVDPRTDIYAAGTVLYEMATGQLPFAAEDTARLVYDIAHKQPVTPREYNPRMSAGLESVILKAMEKAPADRYESGRELGADLERVASALPTAAGPIRRARQRRRVVGAAALAVAAALAAAGWWTWGPSGVGGGEGIKTVAVLPLNSLSSGEEGEIFADGMTEALITDLGKIRALRVIASPSVMGFKGSNRPLPEIARELNVEALVVGSVAMVGDRVRVTGRLVRATTEQVLWSDRFDRDVREILALQGELAQTIAREIAVTVTPEERGRLTVIREVDPEVYRTFLTAEHHRLKTTAEGSAKAIEQYRKAINLDPTYAPAYVGLGSAYNTKGLVHGSDPRETYAHAKAALVRALELDDTLGTAHSALAWSEFIFEWDWYGPEQRFRRAVRLNPNEASVRLGFCSYLVMTGHFDEGIAECKRAIELDPLTPRTQENLAWAYFMAGRYDESIAHAEWMLQVDPDWPFSHMYIAWSYSQKGMHEQAVEACERCLAIPELREDQINLGSMGSVYGRAGRRDEARRLLDRILELSTRRYVDPFYVALIHAGLGDHDTAFEWLQKAYEERSPSLVWLRVMPDPDDLRSDPRYRQLLHLVGLPQD